LQEFQFWGRMSRQDDIQSTVGGVGLFVRILLTR
jgi:hypothetical protein